ncbi:hypothetical protein ACIPSA_25095 [Streptomyces sp. NPDC086549]|uniref:hypothetical protein n=1 Tax=Streptomyces sp. NPDC086549 TaxID=3365752 RepID=UPI003803D655
MNQRKDTYRAALQREPQAAPSRPAKVTHLHTRYVRVTIELSPALSRDVTRWAAAPVSALGSVGAAVLRPLTSWGTVADAVVEASSLVGDMIRPRSRHPRP